jgi:hypothetical protein
MSYVRKGAARSAERARRDNSEAIRPSVAAGRIGIAPAPPPSSLATERHRRRPGARTQPCDSREASNVARANEALHAEIEYREEAEVILRNRDRFSPAVFSAVVIADFGWFVEARALGPNARSRPTGSIL